MNVPCRLTIVIPTLLAPTLVDHFSALVRVDILEMELFAKVNSQWPYLTSIRPKSLSKKETLTI